MIVVGGWPGRNVVGLNGAFGVRPAAFAIGGDFANPLANDVDAGDATTEFVAVVTALPGSGTVTFNDDGGFSHAGAADGTYTTTFNLFTWAQGGPLTAHATPEPITTTIGAAGTAFSVAPAGLASTLAYGVPTVTFTVPNLFSVVPAGLASSVAMGSPIFTFTLPDNGEPVTVDEAKLSARVDGDDLNDLVLALITAAREQAEHITGRMYRRASVRISRRDWPAVSSVLPVNGAASCAIQYWDGSDWQTLSPSLYLFAPGGVSDCGTVLAPAPGQAWPTLGELPIGPLVKIDLTAGPATPAVVPAQVKLYIKAQVAAWLNSPEALAGKDLVASPLMERLLDAERLWC